MIAAVWVLFFVGFSLLALTRHPLYALAVYFGTVYVHPPSRWWSSMLPETRWALISAIVMLWAIWLHRRKIERTDHWLSSAPAVLMSIYIVWMWIQVPWAMDVESHVEGTIKYMKYLMAFWFIYRLCDTLAHLRVVLLLHVLGCALLGILAYYTPREGGRLNGVGGPGIDDANTLGMYLTTGALLCVGLMVSSKGWRRWALLIPLALIGEGFVLANSRGSFLGLIAGGLALSACIAKAHRASFWALAMVGVLGFAAAVDQVFIDRMFTIGDVSSESEEADMSARSRKVVAEAQLRMAVAYPHGSGYRGTVVLSPKYLDRQWLTVAPGEDESQAGRASHNTFLTHLVEFGVPGATLFLTVVVWVVSRIVVLRRWARRGVDPAAISLGGALCAALVAIFVSGTATDYFMAEVQFWLLAALAADLRLGRALIPEPRDSRLGRAGAVGQAVAGSTRGVVAPQPTGPGR